MHFCRGSLCSKSYPFSLLEIVWEAANLDNEIVRSSEVYLCFSLLCILYLFVDFAGAILKEPVTVDQNDDQTILVNFLSEN